MSVKNTENGATARTRLSKSIVLAMRELMRQTEPNDLSLDLVAFMVLALEQIEASVDQSVLAWEKRDYWLKADQFRREWVWAEKARQMLTEALVKQDWGRIIAEVAAMAQPLAKVQVSQHHRLGEPWHGAWKAFQDKHR